MGGPLYKNIKRLRKRAGLTLDAASQRAGLHRVTWSDIERGKNDNPTPKTLEKIAVALGCSLAELFTDQDGSSVVLEVADQPRSLDLDVKEELERLGPKLLAGIVRCSFSSNRLVSGLHLLTLNYSIKDEGVADRNKGSLVFWMANEIYEAAIAIGQMKNARAQQRLRWAKEDWKVLLQMASRWRAKDSPFLLFRNKASGHRDMDTIIAALEAMKKESKVIPYLEMRGPKVAQLCYPGADEITYQGWILEAELDDLIAFAKTMEDDVIAFAKLFERVFLDLMAPAVTEDPEGALTTTSS